MAVSAQAQAETLADALTSAYRHSGLLEQNRATLRAADEDVAQAIAALRPVVSWAGDVTRTFGVTGAFRPSTTFVGGIPVTTSQFSAAGSASTTASINVLAQITLFDGGRNRLGIDVAKEAVLATRAGLVSAEQQVMFRAVQAFMEMRRAIETVALRQNNVRVIRQELRAARDRFEVGEVTRTDVSLADARLSAARSALAAAEGQLQIAIEEYRAAIGRKPGKLVAPRGLPRLPANVENAKAIALRNHPEMVRAQRLVAANELGIALAEAAVSPTVTLDGRYGITENIGARGYNRGGSIGLNASGPIYSGGALNSAVRQARAERDAARGSLHTARHDIAQAVGNAYAQLRVASASRDAFEDQVRASTVAFRGVREEAKLGARTTLDVLDAEQELLDARASLVSAQVDEMIAGYAVLFTLGQLTADDLGLDVPRYDPAEYYNLVKDAPAKLSKQGRELDRVLRAIGKD
ncbi:TolC family outer membrane protein [Thalassococcus lentus]|uniref:TolC family outer membrane protein n=1 Tax=Thalassococcus lentus TaxID=1210524 RepID=A0ABT4XX66_9RHOB|nr:TolC family outer membrane protein [Thalassococcus lentus]MDA7426528.1 TolC family outer membrane protein [Thalassococcus lentus]